MAHLYPGGAGGATRDFVALPNGRDPRMFMPASPRLASRAFRRARRPTSARDRAQTTIGSAFLRAGGGRLLRSGVRLHVAGSVEETLSELLGQPVTAAVFLGPRRANRKPVLQVLDQQGELVAIAKVGVDGLTSDLARNEASALRQLGSSAAQSLVETPSLVAEHTWAGHVMVVQSPLEIASASTDLDDALVTRAMVEIARTGGVRRVPLGASSYLPRLRDQVEAMPHAAARERGRAVLDELATDVVPLGFGAWHGDLTRWNLCTVGGRVMVWDWERYAADVPLGFDSLHHVFINALTTPGTRESAAVDLLARSDDLLAPHDSEPGTGSVVPILYLLEIASRFSGDGLAAAGKAAGDVESWLLPALAQALAARRR